MQGLTPLAIAKEQLQKVTLPPLIRPLVRKDDEPTEELVAWAIKYYAYSVLAHLRMVLRGVVLLAKAENIPTTYFACRNIFEWAAHACYMSRNLANYVNKKEWGRAWHVLSQAVMGNKWMKGHGPKYEPTVATAGVPDPLGVANVIAAYDEWERQQTETGEAKDDYGLLSEYSHPNSACIQQYHEYEGSEVRFVSPSTGSPLPIVNWCLIDLLMFITKLLQISQEQLVLPQVIAVLKAISSLAPAKRQ